MKLFRCLLTVLTAIITLMGCQTTESAEEYYLFVGTYTQESSEGIYLYKFDAGDGSLDSLGTTTGVKNPSYLAFSPDHKNVYAVNEMADSARATVSAFSFDKKNNSLTFLNKQSSGGGAPCYISVDKTGQYAFVGNYVGGSLSVLPINSDGSLAPSQQTIQHQGSSVNKKRQQQPHVHCTLPTPDNDALVVTDLGTDYVKRYSFDANSGRLNPDPVSTYKAKAGAGPRHITFGPSADYAYLIEEMSGSVVAFKNQADTLKPIQRTSALPKDYGDAISGADIHVSSDGKYLYASMREDLNQIVIFEIDQENGKLSLAGRQPTGGEHPRNFMVDPTGGYLLAANRDTDNVVVFERDQSTGKLTATGTELNISMPVCLKMMPME